MPEGVKLSRRFAERVARVVRKIEGLRGPGIQNKADTLRIDINAGRSSGGARPLEGVEMRFFSLVASSPVQNDYVLANGATANNNVKIGKPYLLQQTPFDGATLDGLTYTYTDGAKRNVDDGTSNEDQVIVPSYTIVSGAVILAARRFMRGPVVASDPLIEWVDLNIDGRAWAKEGA